MLFRSLLPSIPFGAYVESVGISYFDPAVRTLISDDETFIVKCEIGSSGNTPSSFGYVSEATTIKNIVNVMTNEFQSGSGKKTYEDCIFLEQEDDEYKISESFASMLDNVEFMDIFKELIEFGISRYKRDYENRYQDTSFVLYQKYTYEDVCRLLEWESNEVPLNIGGYKYDSITKTFPVFINYDKPDRKSVV